MTKIQLPQWLSLSLKTLVSLFALYFVGQRLWNEPRRSWQLLFELNTRDWVFILLAFGLIFLNFGLEAVKWQRMIAPFYPDVRFWQAFQAVLAGNTTGIFTPNRVGEYAGRVLFLPEGHRTEAVALTFIDRIGQMLITLWLGTLALGFIMLFHSAKITRLQEYLPWISLQVVWALAVVGCLLATYLFFFPQWLLWFVPKLGNYAALAQVRAAIEVLTPRLQKQVFVISGLRNFTFTSQYLLLLFAFGFPPSPLLGYALIWLVYLVKSVIPSVSLSELGIRESAALAIMTLWGIPAPLIVTATLSVYFFNIAFPALVGMIFVYRIKE